MVAHQIGDYEKKNLIYYEILRGSSDKEKLSKLFMIAPYPGSQKYSFP